MSGRWDTTTQLSGCYRPKPGRKQTIVFNSVSCSRGNPAFIFLKTRYGDASFHPELFVLVESCRLLPPTGPVRDVPGRASAGAPLEQSLNFWLHLWRQSSDFFLPALTPARSFTRRLIWLSSAHVDSELAACPVHKSKRGVAGWGPAQA